jgi:hypothetical protein
MSGAFSVPLTFASIYFNNAPLKFMFAALAVLGVVGACYQVWRDSVSTLRGTIADRDAEIERLKHRPSYDGEHLRLAQLKVDALTDAGKDLVCFLLHNGPTEVDELQKRCQNPAYFSEAAERTRQQKLVIINETGNPGQASVKYFWEVNPQFRIVMQDLLGMRETRYFL